ncbi:hypothetical protein [Candidatus Infernicultor aquiphilus]
MSKQIIPSPSKEYFSYIPRPLRGEGRVRVKHSPLSPVTEGNEAISTG